MVQENFIILTKRDSANLPIRIKKDSFTCHKAIKTFKDLEPKLGTLQFDTKLLITQYISKKCHS